MRIIYLGNMNCGYPTTIDTLTPMLKTLVPVKAVSPFRNKFLRLLHMIRSVIRARSADVVLIDTYSTMAFYYAWLCSRICKWKGVRYIPYLHGGNLPERVDNNGRWLNRYFTQAAIIISPSGYPKDSLEQRGYGPVRFIYNFIHLRNYSFKIRNNARPRILWVRSFHELYNPAMAIRLLATVQEKYNDAELCMVGPDKDGSTETCKTLARQLNVNDRVTFKGRLTKAEWCSLSAGYDIFINTTNFDNMPVSVIEAMALGMVVVSTNAGGLPYLLQHEKNSLMVEKNDHLAMAAMITRLVEDAALTSRLSHAARERAEEFDWEQVKNSWLELINEHA